MKVTVIHGVSHEGCSCSLGRLVLEKMGCRDAEEFFLPRDMEEGGAGRDRILEAVDAADVLLFTTPTYCMRCSSGMKRFMESTYTYWLPHKPRECMFSKRAAVLSTAAGYGEKDAVKDVTNMLFWWGVPKVRGYGVALHAGDWDSIPGEKMARMEKQAEDIARFLVGGRPRVGLKTRMVFGIMRSMHLKSRGIPSDREYWELRGWLGKRRPWNRPFRPGTRSPAAPPPPGS